MEADTGPVRSRPVLKVSVAEASRVLPWADSDASNEARAEWLGLTIDEELMHQKRHC